MKLLYTFSFLVFLSNCSIGQNDKLKFNFSLVVDEKMWITYTKININILSPDGDLVDHVVCTYYPGEISMEKSNYDRLTQSESDSLQLEFTYTTYKKNGKEISHEYLLPFYVSWLEQYYFVMMVYNLDNPKYKKTFNPLDSRRNYTYELAYPGGQTLQIRN